MTDKTPDLPLHCRAVKVHNDLAMMQTQFNRQITELQVLSWKGDISKLDFHSLGVAMNKTLTNILYHSNIIKTSLVDEFKYQSKRKHSVAISTPEPKQPKQFKCLPSPSKDSTVQPLTQIKSLQKISKTKQDATPEKDLTTEQVKWESDVEDSVLSQISEDALNSNGDCSQATLSTQDNSQDENSSEYNKEH